VAVIVSGVRHESIVIDRLAVGWAPDGHNCFDALTPTKCAPVKDILLGHWTAGTGKGDVVAARMKRRRSKTTGQPLRVGMHLLVDPDGSIRQYADLAHSTIHVGWREAYRRSIGVEVVGGPGEPFTPEQDDAIHYLIDWLTSYDGPELDIPRVDAPMTRFTPAEQRAFRGVQEHRNVPRSSKVDAGGRWLALV
jgi:hypothetical protein